MKEEEVDVLGYPSLIVPMETIIHGRNLKQHLKKKKKKIQSCVKEEVEVSK